MAAVNYRDGIAILQLITFPVILVLAFLVWKRTGWKAGFRTWRCVVTLSLLRIAGGICTLLTITNDDYNIYIAEAVCELIGTAPLLLTYIGILRQIDIDLTLRPRFLSLVTIATFVGLILGIAGVSTTDKHAATFHPNGIVKGAMGVFLAVFAIFVVLTGWLVLQLQSGMSSMQKKLLLAIGLSCPFLLVRMVYSAMSDFANDSRFAPLSGNTTVYLCMSVLEEIIAMSICVVFGRLAVIEEERKQIAMGEIRSGLEVDRV